ncbi:DUF488 domain-containing protein [Couchioplanes caeruleus]|uniref:DUF488 domain-containing protein n=1 Tax=Couchioplanes caeruleus TaxID=56438 RepID=UPI0020C0A308|nr:DUF488 domain-containing protein [Couchioplanes caeruleus]UQU61315.1 DUF488 domain-containing protein [Couchioplanes caeruleus]
MGLITVGHGTAGRPELASLLQDAGVRLLVDIRRFPGSRAHPHVRREALEQWLPEAGISYRWEPRLGGRRPAPADSPDVWWQVPAFRGYAAYMRTPEFLEGVDALAAEAGTVRTAVMCSETLWWRCHRRMLSDFLVLVRGLTVEHLDHRGALSAHRVAAGARVSPPGRLVYDVL